MLQVASSVKMKISAIIQYIIDGIVNDKVNKIILYDVKSIFEIKRKFDVYEAMKNRFKY